MFMLLKVISLRIYDNTGCLLRLFYAAMTAVSAHEAKKRRKTKTQKRRMKPYLLAGFLVDWLVGCFLVFFSSYTLVLIEKCFNQYKLFLILTGTQDQYNVLK